MARVLILFASVDGQTGRIAAYIGERLRAAHHSVVLQSAGECAAPVGDCDAVLVGGGIRYGHYPHALQSWARAQRADLDERPNAFFSVCLSAGGPGAKPEVAQDYIDEFADRTGWRPRSTVSFAGALLYRRYNAFIRFMMRLIVGASGGDTDTSRDYEYTDWDAVDRFADEFAKRLRKERVPLSVVVA
jgi:menaquinone-dependent protoporphyrinogen oxidase